MTNTDSTTAVARLPLLEAKGVTVRFGGLTALSDVSFSVDSGSTFGIVGPNGAGKSALLNCICGVYRLSEGSITFNGATTSNKRPETVSRGGVARTFQSMEYFHELSVSDYMMLARADRLTHSAIAAAISWPPLRRRESQQRASVHEVLDRFNIGELARYRLSELPYGIQKLIDIARVVASESKIVLLDEPTSGINTDDRQAISSALDLLAQERTVVLIDHDVDFVERHCDKILALSAGRALATGRPSEVFAHPEVSAAFLGIVM